MMLRYAKMDPTRNMTILVLDPVPRPIQARVAEMLMDESCVGGEQVGFLERPALPGARARLQMMGGEFCGNATMSLAAFLAHGDGLADGCEADIPLEISGADGLLNCRIRREGESYLGTVDMPLPEAIREAELDGIRCPLVCFPGIAHAIVPADRLDPAAAEKCIADWCARTGMDAFGILLREKAAFRPLVYVRETDSSVWEQGCGSGTAAIGAWEAVSNGRSAQLDLSQPGGVIRVHAEMENGAIRRLSITGRVRIDRQGEVRLSCAELPRECNKK